MSTKGLEHYTKDELVEELINRQTFAGVVVYCRGDTKTGRLEAGEIVITKSPSLSYEGVTHLLETGQMLVSGMFAPVAAQLAAKLTTIAESPPLRLDDTDVYRVGGSRVALDLVVEQYENGMSPEEKVRAYDTLTLADVYAVIAYYLRHRDEVGAYLKLRMQEAEALRVKIEAGQPLLSREELF